MFAIYLSIPVLSLLKEKVKSFSYMVLCVFITVSLGDVLEAMGIEVVPEQLHLPICGGYLIYPLLGYALHHQHIGVKGRIAIYLVGMLAAVAHFHVTACIPPDDGSINLLLKGYLKFPAVLYAAAVMVFVKYNAHRILDKMRLRKIVDFVKPTTLSIYLVHIYAYHFLCSRIIDNAAPFQYMSGAVVSFFAIACIVRFLQRMP